MARRPGLTLTEVLVTLAILAFGILAILTLFPLAASQMAVAVREDRSAQAANAADGYMRAYWKKEFVEKGGTGEPTVMSAFDDPDGGGPLPVAAAGEPSYPVMIDPMGYLVRPNWVGDGSASKLARKTLSALNGNSQYSFRACSLMDGMGYDDNGRPTPDREMRYNWAWLLQRPVNGGADNNTATMDVLVYDNRPNLYAPTGMEGTFDTASPLVVPGTTTLNLAKTAGVLPNVKPGMWIMDVTDPTVNTTPPNKIRHANCYQVVTVTPDATGNVVYLELQTPLKLNPGSGWPAGSPFQGKFVVLRGVSGVYKRLPLMGS